MTPFEEQQEHIRRMIKEDLDEEDAGVRGAGWAVFACACLAVGALVVAVLIFS